MSEEDNRLAKLLDRIHQVESRIQQLEAKKNNPIERIKQDLIKQKIYSGRFIKVQSDYYDLTLEDRAKLLHGNTNQLCKSIIFENTSCSHDNCNDPTDSKYYCVIIQYVAKIDTILLRNLIHSLRKPEDRLSKKYFNFQLTSEEKSLELTGFGHNAISPFGLLGDKKIPIVICSRCLEVNPPVIFLGGGEVDVKLSLPVSDLLQSVQPITGLITNLR